MGRSKQVEITAMLYPEAPHMGSLQRKSSPETRFEARSTQVGLGATGLPDLWGRAFL